ncbi:MAG: hypothetical protein WCL71_07745 [Deltaproteobacteria bacterium]
MSIKKLSFMLLSAFSLAALLSGCGSSSKKGTPGDTARVASEGICIVCHATSIDQKSGTNIVTEFAGSGHNPALGRSSAAHAPGCQGCHGGGSQHNGVGPMPYPNPFNSDGKGTTICANCHAGAYGMPDALWAAGGKDFNGNCAKCHNKAGSGSIHGVQPIEDMTEDCVVCHSVAAPNHGANLVNDNNGVRAIITEFAKWSHHVTGVTLNAAHCAACHLEGKIEGDKVVVDRSKHMVDAKIHLRNSDDDSEFLWDPAAPNHTNIDNFCMGCHDANGAISPMSLKIQAFINANPSIKAGNVASTLNPFGDTISNQYDKMLRGRVVNVSDQFNLTNYSHHAVKGKKYTGRTRVAGATRAVASPSTFKSYSGTATFANTSSTYGSMVGTRETIYEAARFTAVYTTLANADGESGARNGGSTLGDDSTLHCGDCHTVGQWKANAAKNGDGSNAPAAIGAHGSANEYMLRNSIGTDQLHRGAQYNYNPVNMLGGASLPITTAPAGNFAGMKFGEFPTGLPHTTVNMANQAVPATEVPTAQPFLVCYNCHVYTEYGSVYFSNTAQGGREGSHTFGDHTRGNYCNGPYNTSGSGRASTYTQVYGKQVTGSFGTFPTTNPATNTVGVAGFNFGRLQPGTAANYTDGTTATSAVWCSATVLNSLELKTQGTGINRIVWYSNGKDAPANNACDGTSGFTSLLGTTAGAYAGMNGSGNGGGNIFQIQCASCHNSGTANGFGGIHGSKINTYISAAGQVTNARRFLPGLGNAKWVPGDPGAIEAMQWEQEGNANGGSASGHQPGCYTLSPVVGAAGGNLPLPAASEGGITTGTGQMFGTWGSCTDHNNVDSLERTMIRPVTY